MNTQVQVESLSADSFAEFGEVIYAPPATPHDGAGEGWKMWLSPTRLPADRPIIFGTVHTDYRAFRFEQMERHVDTWELLYPHGGSLIQAVAAPHDLDDDTAVPRPDKVRAFLIHPGQAIVMAPGTWHAAALPVTGTTTYTFAALAHPTGELPVWIDFSPHTSVELEIGK